MDVFFDWRWWLENIMLSGKLSSDSRKEIDGELVYNTIFLKTKIKSHGDGFCSLGFCSLERWELLPSSVSKRV